jgi:hypothetical protein
MPGARDLVSRMWATVLALVRLEWHAVDTRGEWQLLADKAREWLGRMAARTPDRVDWFRLAHRFLTQ